MVHTRGLGYLLTDMSCFDRAAMLYWDIKTNSKESLKLLTKQTVMVTLVLFLDSWKSVYPT